ncbi:hypothetical protein M3J09_005546 [Ascochyta lentis]
MRVRPHLPDQNASHDKEVRKSDAGRAQIRDFSKVMGGEGEERSGEHHLDRGKSSVVGKPGSRIGEPEEGESVHAISNQVKLPGAITGRHNRAFFGRSGCRILQVGYAWRACLLARCGSIIMI